MIKDKQIENEHCICSQIVGCVFFFLIWLLLHLTLQKFAFRLLCSSVYKA